MRLDEVADVQHHVEPARSSSTNGCPGSVDIGVDVAGRDVDAVASDIDDLLKARNFPLEYHAELLERLRGPAGGSG